MRMRWLLIGVLLSCWLLGCAADEPQRRVGIHQRDSLSSDCKRECDRQRQRCAQPEQRDAPPREVAGPQEVSREEWRQRYLEAQQRARRCQQEHRECISRCLD